MARVEPMEVKVTHVDDKATVQACPVCHGRGWMPAGFFTGIPSTAQETCKPCLGGGLLWVASGRAVHDYRKPLFTEPEVIKKVDSPDPHYQRGRTRVQPKER